MLHEIAPENFAFNVFQTVGKDWLLITAEKEGKVNTMTASWGGMGVLWGAPVAYLFIRPQRYTKEFVDSAQRLSLSVLPEEHRKALTLFGTVSGRDKDKIGDSGLALAHLDGVPYFAASKAVFLCRKLYAQELQEGCFLSAGESEKWYPEKDYHTLYVVEIEKILAQG